jgi:hypothetical protein
MESLLAAGHPTPFAAVLPFPGAQLTSWTRKTCLEGKQRISLLGYAGTCFPNCKSCEQSVHRSLKTIFFLEQRTQESRVLFHLDIPSKQ